MKAQIHAGGRGKGGGVKLANSPDEAAAGLSQILGMQLVTHQTGPQGQKVKTVLVEEQMPIERELYLAVLIDGAAGRPVMMASAAGGMEIEEVAAKTPEAIHRVTIDPVTGFQPHLARELCFALGPHRRPDEAGRPAHDRPLRRVHREGRVARRDQPARRHRRTAACSRSTRR